MAEVAAAPAAAAAVPPLPRRKRRRVGRVKDAKGLFRGRQTGFFDGVLPPARRLSVTGEEGAEWRTLTGHVPMYDVFDQGRQPSETAKQFKVPIVGIAVVRMWCSQKYVDVDTVRAALAPGSHSQVHVCGNVRGNDAPNLLVGPREGSFACSVTLPGRYLRPLNGMLPQLPITPPPL